MIRHRIPCLLGFLFLTLVQSGNSATTECPAGYICEVLKGVMVDSSEKTLCTTVKENVKIAGYGNILDGTYCPGGEGIEFASLRNCPAGHYCDNPAKEPKKCPAGYYCPAKTSNPKDFKCRGCEEGAERYPIRVGSLIVLLLFSVVLPLFAILFMRLMKRRQAANESESSESSKLKVREHEEMQKLKPMLQKIETRLGNAYSLKLNKKGEVIDYDSQKLFDAIDTNKNGVLSFSELENALGLSGDKLLVFINLMNESSGFSSKSSNHQVSRTVFSISFFDTMKSVANYDPTHEDAGALFEEIAGSNDSDNISLETLKYSPLALFLTDKELLNMKRLFQKKIEAAGDDAESQDSPATSKGKFAARSQTISKKKFAAWYPSVLSSIVRTEEVQLEPCDLHFEKLSLHVQVNDDKIPVVNDVTGRVRSGTMSALMGGSGAGKTSLLNALCGRAYYGSVSGKIVINGQEAKIEDCTDVMGFVPQDDIVFAELTVKENLIYAGKFKLPRGTPLTYIAELADEVIADLGLTRVADSMVGDVHRRGVSGGEKKRVNIGLELMAKPSILFLDEPTSGLDSSSAMVVMQSLKRLVQNQGMTVCSVIHQPRKTIFELFDSLILLGVGGNLVYHGPTDTAHEYFTNMRYSLPEGESLADWLIDISSGELSPTKSRPLFSRQQSTLLEETSNAENASTNRDRLYKSWSSHFQNLSSKECAIYEKPAETPLPAQRLKPGFLSQTQYQFTRCAILFHRNFASELQEAFLVIGGTLAIVLLEKTLQLTVDSNPNIPNEYAVLTSLGTSEGKARFGQVALPLLCYHATRGLMNFLNFATKASVVICVLTALASTKALTEKRVEFFREAGSGYSINAYYLAVNAFDTIEVSVKMILAALCTVAFRNSAASVGAMVLQFILLGWIAASWGLVFPLCVPSKNVVMVTGFFSIFTALLLSGAPSTPIEYKDMYESPAVNALSSFIGSPRFFVESLAVNEFKATPEQHGFTRIFLNTNFENGFSNLGLGQGDLKVYEQTTSGWYWGVLPSIFVGLTIRTLGFILMHSCNRPQRLKQTFWKDFKESASVKQGAIFFACVFFGFAVLAAVFFSA